MTDFEQPPTNTNKATSISSGSKRPDHFHASNEKLRFRSCSQLRVRSFRRGSLLYRVVPFTVQEFVVGSLLFVWLQFMPTRHEPPPAPTLSRNSSCRNLLQLIQSCRNLLQLIQVIQSVGKSDASPAGRNISFE